MQNPQKPELSAEIIWGKVVTWLRQNKETLLQITCGEIVEIKLENGAILAKTTDQYAYDRIMQPNNLDKIKKALIWQGLNGSFKLALEKSEGDKTEEDLQKLKKIFGDVKIET